MAVSPKTYEAAFDALLDLYEQMIVAAEAQPSPFTWDEEYAEIHVEECLDRMIVAGPVRPSPGRVDRFRRLTDRACPFSES